ncbi:unnamed protein product [Effrenium voratum]|nr:unnamed protein product [Effrenium voratum]
MKLTRCFPQTLCAQTCSNQTQTIDHGSCCSQLQVMLQLRQTSPRQHPMKFPEIHVDTTAALHPRAEDTAGGQCGIKLDQKSIEFFALFCGGHRGIFIAAMHWVKSMQNGEGWEFDRTVELVRCSYGNGDWKTDTEILAFVRQSRAVRINGRFNALEQIPREFAELLCKGATSIAKADVRRELTINGFVLPKHDRGIEGEFQKLDWNNAHMTYQVANPLLAS